MTIFNGQQLADQLEAKLKTKLAGLKTKPRLCVFLLTDDSASQLYVAKKQAAAERVGIEFELIKLDQPESAEVIKLIQARNIDPQVKGIMVQLPLAKNLNERRILDAIEPTKDVDGLTSYSLGLLMAGQPKFLPATVKGIMTLLNQAEVNLIGKRAVVIGASNIVGKPLALALSQAGASVSLVRSTEKNLAEITKIADVLVTAVGKPALIKAEMVKDQAIVIDVGITHCNQVGCQVVGDVDFEAVKNKASLITPVPGGVGPLTVISLLENLLL